MEYDVKYIDLTDQTNTFERSNQIIDETKPIISEDRRVYYICNTVFDAVSQSYEVHILPEKFEYGYTQENKMEEAIKGLSDELKVAKEIRKIPYMGAYIEDGFIVTITSKTK